MYLRFLSFLSAVILIFSLLACSSSSDSATASNSRTDSRKAAQQAAKGKKPPSGSPLARVEKGMSDEQVRSLLGTPSDAVGYTTGKNWIPFYWGPDTSRTDWIYRGIGRVVFSRNRYSGGLKVIRVDYNPKEMM